MRLTNKKRWLIAVLYSCIAGISNYIGAVMPSTFSTASLQSIYMQDWLKFINENIQYVKIINVVCFMLPSIFSFLYVATSGKERYYSRFINLPIVFSLIGMTGWVTYFFAEVAALLFAKSFLDIMVAPILLTSLMFSVLEFLLSFTISYFTLETIHRKIVLPKYFSEGHLNKYRHIRKPSLRFLFFIFYVSTGLFPVLYTLTCFITVQVNNGIKPDTESLILLMVIILFGIILCAIFHDYFNIPLKKLKEAIEKVKSGDYSARVQIVTTDTFGFIADSFNEMTDALAEKNRQITAMQNSIMAGMAAMLESRDNSTGGHIKRTSDCVYVFVEELKKSPEFSYLTTDFCDDVIKSAPMHDLGKIAVDDEILRKPGKFTKKEYAKMKMHSALGAEIVKEVLKEVDDEEFKSVAVNVAHYHHERYDGSGYPEKLKGDAIPLEARIMAFADVFDALVSKRCYKESFSFDEAFSIINASLGSHFDPELGKIFIRCGDKLKDLYESNAS